MKTILFATDGSESASHAFDVAVELCRETGARLEVLAVMVRPYAGRSAAIPVAEIEDRAAAARIADAAARQASEAGVEVGHRVAAGDAVDEIIRAAEQLPADLIVVGSRGLGAVRGTLLGSVSRALVRRSAVPVTVVKADAAVRSAAHA